MPLQVWHIVPEKIKERILSIRYAAVCYPQASHFHMRAEVTYKKALLHPDAYDAASWCCLQGTDDCVMSDATSLAIYWESKLQFAAISPACRQTLLICDPPPPSRIWSCKGRGKGEKWMSGKNLEKGNTTTQSVFKNTQHIAAQGNVIRNDCGSVTQ